MAASTPEYSASDVFAGAQKWQAIFTRIPSDDPACSSPLSLTETDQDGEHAVYGPVVLSGQSKLKLSVKANGRYGIQFGFVTSDWKSFALANVSLVSGSYRVAESGTLRRKDVVTRSVAGDWLEMEFTAEAAGGHAAKEEISGYAIIKPTIADGNTFYRGESGRGVTLCAAAVKGS